MLALLAVPDAAVAQQGSGANPSLIERALDNTRPGASVGETFDLTEMLSTLAIASVSIAIIDHDRIVWARAFGAGATPSMLLRAAPKLVIAVAVLRLIQDGRLRLDRDVDAELTEWHVPPKRSERFTSGHFAWHA